MNGCGASAPPVGAQPCAPPLWLLAMVTILGTVSNHLFVPAMPAAALALATGPGAIQATVSVYLIGLALGQLVYGPLSDAFGRRPLLLGGLAIFVAGSLLAACAPDLPMLLFARLLQSLGGCAGIALGRAIVRDTTQGDHTVRQLAVLGMMVLFWPGLGPILGGTLAAAAGWRSLFVVLAAVGGLALVLAWRRLPETRAGTARLVPGSVRAAYQELLGHPPFVALVLGAGAITTSIYAFLSAAPFILRGRLHQSTEGVGLVTGVVMFGILIGTALTAWWVRRTASRHILMAGGAALVLSSAGLLLVLQADALTLPGLVCAMLVFTIGIGLVHPVLLSAAMTMHPRLGGSASGLYGCSQMALGALSATLAGLGDDAAWSCALVLAGTSVFSCISVGYALRPGRTGA